MKHKLLHDLWVDFRQGHNIELYFTVLLCFSVFVLGILDIVNMKVVTSSILAVLSLVAISLLENRRTTQGLTQSLEEVYKRINKPSLSKVILPYSKRAQERIEQLRQADEVWILSRTCRMLWHEYQDEFQIVAKRDGLRLLFIDPDDGALDMIAKSAIWQQPDDGERLRMDVGNFINQLKYIKAKLYLDKFDVRLINYLPAWTLILINPRKNNGIIHVEFATYRSHPRKHPGFVVECSLDNELFNQFRNEFEQMWGDARLIFDQCQDSNKE